MALAPIQCLSRASRQTGRGAGDANDHGVHGALTSNEQPAATCRKLRSNPRLDVTDGIVSRTDRTRKSLDDSTGDLLRRPVGVTEARIGLRDIQSPGVVGRRGHSQRLC